MPNETEALAALFEAAADVRVRAHAPYSNFFVGAAVLDEEGRIHVGCNVENAAYPEGTCAEAAAIAAMVASGGRRILAVAVVGGPAEGDEIQCPPCGGCRQKIREFAGEMTSVHLRDAVGTVSSLPLGELLPLSFGPGHL
ncbi:MAG: cytidine deaminase [Hyphomicrobiales bacterium]|nr:cytidine deaminase [Hyphomicrobiales bacterium]